MSGDEFTEFDEGKLQQAIDDLKAAQKSLTATTDTLKDDLDKSLNQWEDDAKQAYTQAKIKWDNSAAKMGEIIAKMEMVMDQIKTRYGTNKTQVTQSWS